MKAVNYQITQLQNYQRLRSSALQLRILLYQLLQAEARELYRNLGFFAFSFSLVDRALAIFRMAHLLPGAESALASRLFDRRLGNAEFLSPRGKELGDVLDGVIGHSRSGGLLPA